jgi:hypothetical protein
VAARSTIGTVSKAIEFDDVRRHVEHFGGRATLVTVTEANTPHVVTAIVRVGDGALSADVGSRTRANLTARPGVCLVWEAVAGVADGEYQLILDATARPVGAPDSAGIGAVSITVTSGIMHRLAGLASGPSTCLALSEA